MLTVPPEQSAGHADQAEPKSLDFQILAMRGTGVVSGCVVAAQSTPNMTLQITAGTVEIAGVAHTYAGGNVTVTANASTNPRYDAVVVNTSGAASVIAGTAAAEDVLDDPAVDLSTYCVLKIVYVPGGSPTAITNAELVDKSAIQDSGVLDISRIPSTVATDTEVATAVSDHTGAADPHGDRAAASSDATTKANAAATAAESYSDTALSTHAGAADPHTGYQKESERNANNGYAGLGSTGLLAGSQMPLPTGSALGGVQALTAPTHQFLKSIGTNGVPTAAQPVAGDVGFTPVGTIASTDVQAAIAEMLSEGIAQLFHFSFSTAKSALVVVTTEADADGLFHWTNDTGRTLTFVAIRARAEVGPSGSTCTLDFNVDGTTIMTGTKVVLPDNTGAVSTVKQTTFSTTTIADGHVLSMNVDTAGGGAMKNLLGTVWMFG